MWHDPQALEASLKQSAQEALDALKKQGCHEADVCLSYSTEFEVKVADGAILTLSQATQKVLGMRAFDKQRLGFCTSHDWQSQSLKETARQAYACAKVSAEDVANTLPAYDNTTANNPAAIDLQCFDPQILQLPATEKIAWAHRLEKAAKGYSPAIKTFRDNGVSTSAIMQVLLTSQGFCCSWKQTQISLWSTPVAEKDGLLQTDFHYDAKSHLSDLDDIEGIAQKAASRACRMLGARSLPTQRLAIVFEPMMAAGFLGSIVGAMDGYSVFKKSSFLGDKLGQSIASPLLTLVDDPHRPRAFGSSWFDAEGMPSRRQALIEQGILKLFLYDHASAVRTGQKSSGHAQRSAGGMPHPGIFNLTATPGSKSMQTLLAESPRVLLVTRGLGRGLNTVSGEYSRGASGLLYEKGELVGPVQEITLAADALDMLKNIDAVSSDVALHGPCYVPALRIQDMMVSGKG